MNWILNLRTEFSFKEVFGPIDRTAQLVASQGHTVVGIADVSNTFGHVPWARACKQNGIRPVFGVTVNAVATPKVKTKQLSTRITLVAMTSAGLREIYELLAEAYHPDNFYYVPRIGYADIASLSSGITVITPRGGDSDELPKAYQLVTPATNPAELVNAKLPLVAGQFNFYPTPNDLETYQLFAGGSGTVAIQAQHIITAEEWRITWPGLEGALYRAETILEGAGATLKRAGMVRYRATPMGLYGAEGHNPSSPTLKTAPASSDKASEQPTGQESAQDRLIQLARAGASRLGYDLENPVALARLERELSLIEQKDYADYFLITADMIQYAKRHMLVGPSRGSSAGSLVCYLIGITEIDPLEYDLLFERFIDINREDLPDIDCDFPDDKRYMVMEYLEQKYGKENVAHIGTVSRLMPKSAIGGFAKALDIPLYETTAVKGAIIERSSGDARAAQCIEDTFVSTDIGKEFIQKYPAMALVANVEGHANHTGVHAAGIIITNDAITNYAGVNTRDSVMMMDKYDAEYLGLLKIDVLGLRTLTILADVCDRIGMSYEELYRLELDDQETFKVFNDMRLWGIFQFEGYALQSLTRQMGIHKFNDIVAITALARPGPLHTGGAADFIARRIGKEDVVYIHDAVKPMTEETYGTVVYQEQVMQIVREVGSLSWEDTSQLRKAMSKSLGDEFFNSYWEKFRAGTDKLNIDHKTSRTIWESIMTFGSWAFNKSHAVSYALVSYWTAYMKAHHPLEFTVATLNNSRSEDQGVKILRDMVRNAGVKYTPVTDQSSDQWQIIDGELLGPLTLIKGIGPKKALDIIERRKIGAKLTPSQQRMLADARTIYDELYPAEKFYGDYYTNPRAHNIVHSDVARIANIEDNGTYVFLGCLKARDVRDMNDYNEVIARGGQKVDGNSIFLNLLIEDDTDSIMCKISRWNYPSMGKLIAEGAKVDEDWFLIKGTIKNNWRKIHIERILCLTNPTLTESKPKHSSGYSKARRSPQTTRR